MKTRWTVIISCLVLLFIMLKKLGVQMARLDGDLSVYYHSANELTSGLSPYYAGTHYIYPPLFAWLIAPLALLTPVQYAIAWGLVLGACWVVSVYMIRRLTGETGIWVELVPNVVLFRCIWNGYGHGQLSLLMSAMLLTFLVLERERKMIGATFWFAFAGAVKVFPFYMGVTFLTRENFKWIPLLGLWTIGLTALPAISVGFPALWTMIFDGFFGWGMKRIEGEHGLSVNHGPVNKVFQLAAIDNPHALKLALLGCMIVVTGVMLCARRSRDDRGRDNLYLSLALTSSLMVCPHVWMHYFTLLLLPFAAAIAFVRANPGTLEARVLTAGLLLSGFAFNSGSKLFASDELSAWFDRAGFLAWGLVVLWASLAFVCVACKARPPK